MARSGTPIEVFNRYTGRVERESIYGESWLRWSYGTTLGRLTLALAVKRVWFSRWYGWRMSRPGSARLIAPFIARYGLDPGEFVEPPEAFRSFNDFFSRRLKLGARPICPEADAIVFPADGRHLGFGDLGAMSHVYAKGQYLSLVELFQDPALVRLYERGALVISRLCPVDYHRFHFPVGGRCGAGRLINGVLFSVSPIALRRSLHYLVQNKRVVTMIEDTPCGRVAMVEIGATCVGTILHTASERPVEKGEEKGLFRFGGSCVLTFFEPGRVQLAPDLLEQPSQGRELYARMGDRMGTVLAGSQGTGNGRE